MTDLGTIVRGDRERFMTVDEDGNSTIVLRDADGAELPDATLTGWTLRWTGREGSSLGAVLFELDNSEGGAVEIVDAAARIVRVNLRPADYEDLPLGEVVAFWDLEGIPPGDEQEVHTLDRGILTIVPGSTR